MFQTLLLLISFWLTAATDLDRPLTLRANGRATHWQGEAAWENGRRSFNNLPGLQEFSFDYSDTDKQFRSVGIIPSERSVETRYYDQNGDDSYSFRATGVEFPVGTFYRLITHDDYGHRSGCYTTPPLRETVRGYVPFLQAFQISYPSGDTHLDHIRVRVMTSSDGWPQVSLCLGDNTPNDVYEWWVRYAMVPSDKVGESRVWSGTAPGDGTSSGSCVLTGDTPYEKALQGFDFDFLNGDHHIDVIKVDISNGCFFQTFEDRDGPNDPYAFNIYYGEIRK